MKTLEQLRHDRDLCAYSITGSVLALIEDIETMKIPGTSLLRQHVDRFIEIDCELHAKKEAA